MKLNLYVVGFLILCSVAQAFDFSSTSVIDTTTYFKGNGTIVFPDRTDISNGFNISTKFKVDTIKHEYIIWSKNRYLLQITVDGYIQAGIYNTKGGWCPLATDCKLALTNVWYNVTVQYNNSDFILTVDKCRRTAKANWSIENKNTLTYIGNRDDWSRDLQGYIEYLVVTPYPKSNTTPIPQPIVCGNGKCESTENKDNCPDDCGLSNTTRNLGGTYHTTNQSYVLWKELADSTPYGSYEVIGKSIQGRDIMLFMFGNPNGGKVMIDSRGHGPEDCGGEIGYTFVKWLLTNNSNASNRILRENYVMFIPVVNPDTTRRQNMRANYTLADGSILKVAYGVDLNRNGISGFGGSGSSNASNNYEYRGLYGGSEPETQALAFAEQKYRPDIYVNTHCGMNMWHYCTNNNITKAIIAQVKNVSPVTISKYPPGGQCTGGYIMAQASSYGANAWIFEIAMWGELPKTLEEYNKKFYPLAVPVYEAMCNAVGKQ
jgi:hypothetical protein